MKPKLIIKYITCSVVFLFVGISFGILANIQYTTGYEYGYESGYDDGYNIGYKRCEWINSEYKRAVLSDGVSSGENNADYRELAKIQAESHEYNLETYNCVNYATDFLDVVRKHGYFDSETVVVNVNCDSGLFDDAICRKSNAHMIVKVCDYIETVSGEPIPTANYDDYGLMGK